MDPLDAMLGLLPRLLDYPSAPWIYPMVFLSFIPNTWTRRHLARRKWARAHNLCDLHPWEDAHEQFLWTQRNSPVDLQYRQSHLRRRAAVCWWRPLWSVSALRRWWTWIRMHGLLTQRSAMTGSACSLLQPSRLTNWALDGRFSHRSNTLLISWWCQPWKILLPF